MTDIKTVTKCPTCSSEVLVGGEGETHFYIPYPSSDHKSADKEKEKLYVELFTEADRLRKENGRLEVKVSDLQKRLESAEYLHKLDHSLADQWQSKNIALEAENARLTNSLKDMFELIEDGRLVRNIEGDSKEDFHVNTLKFVARLKKNHEALSPAPARDGAPEPKKGTGERCKHEISQDKHCEDCFDDDRKSPDEEGVR